MGKCLPVLGLSLVFLAGFFFILALKEDAWVREEVSIKLNDYIKVIMPVYKKYMEKTGKSTGDVDPMTDAFKKMDKVLEPYHLGKVEDMIKKVKYSMRMDFGLQKMCMYLTLKGFDNPIKIFVPSVQWCIKNDVFRNPMKYKLPATVSTVGDAIGFDAFYTSFMCLIVAIVAAFMACIFAMTKSTSLYVKWKKGIVAITITLSIFAVIMSAVAILHINGEFKLKEKYDQGKQMALRGSNSGYEYTGGYQPRQSLSQSSFDMSMLNMIKMKESHGCAMYLAAGGIVLLIFAVIVNAVELCVKSDEVPVSYNKMSMQGI